MSFNQLANQTSQANETADPFGTRKIEIIALPFFIVIGTICNVLTFMVMRRKKMRHQSTYFYMAILAVLDQLVLIFGCLNYWMYVTFNINLLAYSHVLCKSVSFLYYSMLHMSVWMVVVMTIERFIAVALPLQASRLCTVRRAKKVTLMLLFTIGCINLHFVFTHKVSVMLLPGKEDKYEYECAPIDVYQDFLAQVWPWIDACFYSFIPMLLLVIFNLLIIHNLVKASKSIDKLNKTLVDKHQQKAANNSYKFSLTNNNNNNNNEIENSQQQQNFVIYRDQPNLMHKYKGVRRLICCCCASDSSTPTATPVAVDTNDEQRRHSYAEGVEVSNRNRAKVNFAYRKNSEHQPIKFKCKFKAKGSLTLEVPVEPLPKPHQHRLSVGTLRELTSSQASQFSQQNVTKIANNNNNNNTSSSSSSASSNSSSTNRRLTIMLLVVSITFFITSTPLVTLQMLDLNKVLSASFYTYLPVVKAVFLMLQYLNHSINFFLYAVTGKTFRREFYALFRSFGRSKRHATKSNMSTTNSATYHSNMKRLNQSLNANNSNNANNNGSLMSRTMRNNSQTGNACLLKAMMLDQNGNNKKSIDTDDNKSLDKNLNDDQEFNKPLLSNVPKIGSN